MFRYEKMHEPMASRAQFLARVTGNIIAAMLLIGSALAGGIAGYHMIEGMNFTDSFLNAAMLLGGMGPVSTLTTEAGKLFAGCYALLCGLLIVITTGVILAPVLHRVLHALHVTSEAE